MLTLHFVFKCSAVCWVGFRCAGIALSRRLQNKDSTGDEKLSAKALGDYYTKMTEDFPIVSIEDAFDQVRHCCSLAKKGRRTSFAGAAAAVVSLAVQQSKRTSPRTYVVSKEQPL